MPPQQPTGGGRVPSIEEIITRVATQEGVDPRLALSVAQIESRMGTNLGPSAAGAYGVFQLMPETAQRHGVDPRDTYGNILGGVRELKTLRQRWGGSPQLLLRRYNASPDAPPEVTDRFVRDVMADFRRRAGLPPARPGEDTEGRIVSEVATPPPWHPPLVTPGLAAAAPGAATPSRGTGFAPRWSPQDAERAWQATRGFLTETLPTFATETLPAWGRTYAADLAESLDPRTRAGRQNIGGAVGGAIGGAIGAPGGPTAVGTAIAGAGLGGAAMAGLEETENVAAGLPGFGLPILIPRRPGRPGVFGGPPPPPETTGGGRIFQAGVEQARNEALGHAFLFPIKAIGKRVVQSRVGKAAYQYYQREKEEAIAGLRGALGQLQTTLREYGVERGRVRRQTVAGTRGATQAVGRETRAVTAATRRQGEQAVSGAEREAADRLARAQATGAANVQAAETAGADRLATRETEFQAGRPPLVEAPVGRAVAGVVTGPAHAAKQALGEAIDEAARTGPTLDILDLKTEAERILRAEILPPEQAFPRRVPPTPPPAAPTPTGLVDASGRPILQPAPPPPPPPTIATPTGPLTARITEAQAQEIAKHPALGIVARILNAADRVPFWSAHEWKQQLQQSLRGTYDSAVRDKVTGMTDHLAGILRGKLAVHAPYNAATEAYQQVVPVFEEGYAQKIRDVARDAPEQIVQMISPDNPTAAAFLVDLLTTRAAAGEATGRAIGEGGAAAGREALESLQAAWLNRHVLDGPVEKLADRLAALHARPEFVRAFLGDPRAQIVLGNLDQIATGTADLIAEATRTTAAATTAAEEGIQAARRGGAQAVEDARLAARRATEAAQEAGRGQVRTTREAGDRAREQVQRETERERLAQQAAIAAQRNRIRARREGTPAERAFMESTLAPHRQREPLQVAADVYNVARMTVGYWAGMSWARLFAGASDADMLKYIAYSPYLTKQFVTFTHSPWARRAVATGVVRPWLTEPPEPPPASSPSEVTLIMRAPPEAR